MPSRGAGITKKNGRTAKGRNQQLRRAISSGLAIAAFAAAPLCVQAQGTLRIAMTAGDIPTTTRMPNNGFQGMRFLGYPIFEGLILWDLSKGDAPAGLRPGGATSLKQDPQEPSTSIF